jgi:hypothetical protein
MLLDIVILPPTTLRRRLGLAIRKAAEGFSVKYVVDNKKLIPHISLFHMNMKITRERISELDKSIHNSLSSFRPTIIRCRKIIAVDGELSYILSNPPSVKALNKSAIKNCVGLRTGIMPWLPKRRPTILEKKNRELYGVHYNIGKMFNPHFTMLKMNRSHDVKMVFQKLKLRHFQFKANTIALCKVNRRHQVTKILKKFMVKKLYGK